MLVDVYLQTWAKLLSVKVTISRVRLERLLVEGASAMTIGKEEEIDTQCLGLGQNNGQLLRVKPH